LVTDGTVPAPGQLLLTLDATALRAQLAHAREELLAAQERTRIAIAGGDGEDLARLEADLRRTDAELAKLERDRDSLRLFEGEFVALPGGWNRETV
jgi:multidrug resistance efflux pump